MRALVLLGPYCIVAGMLVAASAILLARLRGPSTLVMCLGSLLLFAAQVAGLLQAAGVWQLAFPAQSGIIPSVGNCGAALFAVGLLLLALRLRRDDLRAR